MMAAMEKSVAAGLSERHSSAIEGPPPPPPALLHQPCNNINGDATTPRPTRGLPHFSQTSRRRCECPPRRVRVVAADCHRDHETGRDETGRDGKDRARSTNCVFVWCRRCAVSRVFAVNGRAAAAPRPTCSHPLPPEGGAFSSEDTPSPRLPIRAIGPPAAQCIASLIVR